jgi:2-oxoglutarate ferredoxin oxidoreductase subunit alpha
MIRAGHGYRVHITGLTHNEKGYPAITVEAQQKLIRRLVDKIRNNADKIIRCQEMFLEDAEVVVVAYGITSRVALRAVQMAREQGIAAGLLRPVVVWPFPEKRIKQLAEHARAFVVPEMNYGQLVWEVERCAGGRGRTVLVPHGGGTVHRPEDILQAIQEQPVLEEARS